MPPGCAGMPCLHGGICFESQQDSSKYQCLCMSGWEGRNCEENIDECQSQPCENNSTCVDLVAGYECQCPPGYGGPQCMIGIVNIDYGIIFGISYIVQRKNSLYKWDARASQVCLLGGSKLRTLQTEQAIQDHGGLPKRSCADHEPVCDMLV